MTKYLLIPLALIVTSCATLSRPDHALAHPIYRQYFVCGEHAAGELQGVGDALGTDCVVKKVESIDGRLWARAYVGDGHRNEDWYGWGVDVLSPCDCEVVRTSLNDTTNSPGILGKPPASSITLKRDDGIHFLLAHLNAPWRTSGSECARERTSRRLATTGTRATLTFMSRHGKVSSRCRCGSISTHLAR